MQPGIKRIIGTAMMALAAFGLSQPALAQASSSDVHAQILNLTSDNPGSTLVYVGCRAVADSDYRQTGDVNHALAALMVCAGAGCAFTDSYQNCLTVNAELFILELRQS